MGNFFLAVPPEAKEIEVKTNYHNCIKVKSVCTVGGAGALPRGRPAARGRVFAHDTSNDGLTSKIRNKLVQLNTKTPNNVTEEHAHTCPKSLEGQETRGKVLGSARHQGNLNQTGAETPPPV